MADSARTRFKELVRKLTGNPFFPLLFSGEAVKVTLLNLWMEMFGSGGVSETKNVGVLVLGIIAIGVWLYADVDVDWGITDTLTGDDQ